MTYCSKMALKCLSLGLGISLALAMPACSRESRSTGSTDQAGEKKNEAPGKVVPLRPAPPVTHRRPSVSKRYEPTPKPTAALGKQKNATLALGRAWTGELWPPEGATEQRSLWIVMGSDPESCTRWVQATARGAFVACVTRRKFLEDTAPKKPWEAAVRRVIQETKKRFPSSFAPGSVVLAAEGRERSDAVALARVDPQFFSRLVLVGGGASGWNTALADHFARAGGRSALFLCTTDCALPTRDATWLNAAGIPARVAPREDSNLRWLTQDDPRWQYLPVKENTVPQ